MGCSPQATQCLRLASRLTSTVTRLITGILNQQLVVEFVVTEETKAIKEDDLIEKADPVPDKHPTVLSIQADYQSIYDEIVQSDQVIVHRHYSIIHSGIILHRQESIFVQYS
jgi:hypothetical protein